MKHHAVDIHIGLSCAACGTVLVTQNNGSMEGPEGCEGFELGFKPCDCADGTAREIEAAIRLLTRHRLKPEQIRRLAAKVKLEVERQALPDGISLVPMGDPAAMHNAIADAIGEDLQ